MRIICSWSLNGSGYMGPGWSDFMSPIWKQLRGVRQSPVRVKRVHQGNTTGPGGATNIYETTALSLLPGNNPHGGNSREVRPVCSLHSWKSRCRALGHLGAALEVCISVLLCTYAERLPSLSWSSYKVGHLQSQRWSDMTLALSLPCVLMATEDTPAH